MESEYISGEEHRRQQSAKPPRKSMSPILWPVIAVVILIVGFAGTALYVKSQNKSNNEKDQTANTTNGVPQGGCTSSGSCMTSGGGAPQGGQQSCSGGSSSSCPVGGTITAVSATSITIQPMQGGSTKTYTITSATQEETGPGTAAAYKDGDVKVGDTVAILADESGNAQTILTGIQLRSSQ